MKLGTGTFSACVKIAENRKKIGTGTFIADGNPPWALVVAAIPVTVPA
jgi:hypothetical protein